MFVMVCTLFMGCTRDQSLRFKYNTSYVTVPRRLEIFSLSVFPSSVKLWNEWILTFVIHQHSLLLSQFLKITTGQFLFIFFRTEKGSILFIMTEVETIVELKTKSLL